MMIVFEILIVLMVSVVLKNVCVALSMCVERDPSFFGLFRVPKNVWWHILSFLLTYQMFIMTAWLMFGPCYDIGDVKCVSACVNVRVNAVKTLLSYEYQCPKAEFPLPTTVQMLLDGYWH